MHRTVSGAVMTDAPPWSYARNQVVDDLVDSVCTGSCRRVIGPGGSGKSWLLDALARHPGVAPAQRWNAGLGQPPPEPGGRLLLVDDAHLLEHCALEEVLASRPLLVLAHRPVPGALGELLDRVDHGPVLLGALDRQEAAALLTDLWGHAPSVSVVDRLFALTGGSPRWLRAVGLLGPDPDCSMSPVVDEAVRAERRALSPAQRRLLSVRALLADEDPLVIASAADLEPTALGAAELALAAAGLARDDPPGLIPVVVASARRVGGEQEFAEIALRAVQAATDTARSAHIVEQLLTTAIGSEQLGRAVITVAQRLAREQPDRAANLLMAAPGAGACSEDLAAGRVLLAFHRGRFEDVLSVVDELGVAGGEDLHADARRAAASVLAARGGWDRAARMVADDPAHADLAATGALAAGDVELLDTLVTLVDTQRESLGAARVQAVVTGLRASLDDDALPAILGLLEAVRLQQIVRPSVPLPEPTRVLAALVAGLLGEFDLAAEVVDPGHLEPGPWAARRQRLMWAWVALRRGDWVGAQQAVRQAREADDWAAAEPRDHLLADLVVAGLARRTGDLDTLMEAWRTARTHLLRQPPDLFQSALVGELLVGGARLGDHGTVAGISMRIDELLATSGHPPLWELAVGWDQLHAAVAADDRARAHEQAERVSNLAVPGPRASALIAAAPLWVAALAGRIELGPVSSVVEQLADAGYRWEASRLAGTAAIRTRDAEVMRSLLRLARSLPAPSASNLARPVAELSGREQQVAAQLLAGLTYRQVGEQLYISPKTVEHHVAHIRRKLGVHTRKELLIVLRELLGSNEEPGEA